MHALFDKSNLTCPLDSCGYRCLLLGGISPHWGHVTPYKATSPLSISLQCAHGPLNPPFLGNGNLSWILSRRLVWPFTIKSSFFKNISWFYISFLIEHVLKWLILNFKRNMFTLPTREMLGSQTVKNKQQITIGIDMPTIVTTVIIRKLVSISLNHSQYVQLGKVLFILIRL